MSFQKDRNNPRPLKFEIAKDAAQTTSNERMMGNWLDEIYNDFGKRGCFENLPGKGKSIVVKSGDPLSSVLHNANVLPPWLELQHEIRDSMNALMTRLDLDHEEYTYELNEINKKIKKYNNLVPSSLLQKSTVTKEFIADQYKRWF